MSFRIIRDDITRVPADAIVNTANPEPCFGNGTDRAVYEAAGAEQLLEARKRIGPLVPGQAAVTGAFALASRYIIHTVGPSWIDGEHNEYETLASCYRNSLVLAQELSCESIAFPLISTGVCGFPKAAALRVALDIISEFLKDTEQEMEIILVVFNREAFEISTSLHKKIDQFIDENYVEAKHRQEHPVFFRDRRKGDASPAFSHSGISRPEPYTQTSAEQPAGISPEQSEPIPESPVSQSMIPSEDYALFGSGDLSEEDGSSADYAPEANLVSHTVSEDLPSAAFSQSGPSRKTRSNALLDAFGVLKEKLSFGKPSETDLKNALSHPGESFQEMLFRLIDERKMTDPQVYRKANIDRKLFSKIRCSPDYKPRKKTVIALAIALELDLGETMELLGRAEMAFSPASRSDLIIEYCIENGIYNIIDVNALLFEYDQPTLN